MSLIPIQHDSIWQFRKKIEALHWTAQEVDLSRDRLDWAKMSEEERTLVRNQLAFFSRIDIDVMRNIDGNFSQELDCLEVLAVLAAQADQECTHVESYGLQIEAVMTGEEREKTLNAVKSFPVIARIREWTQRWVNRRTPIAERLIAWAFIEGVQFQGPFCVLQWLRTKNLLPGITEMNSFISRDEGIHTLFTCHLVSQYLIDPPPPEKAYEIFESGMKGVYELITESLPARLVGMNEELMKTYIHFQADCVLHEMGYPRLYNCENPFPFMDAMALNECTKVNFFERRGTQYQNVTKAGAGRLALDMTDADEA